MISACIFDLEGVIMEPGRLDLPEGFASWTPGGAEDALWLKEVHQLLPDDLRDGVFIFIKELKNKGLNLAAVGSCPHLREILNRLQVRHYFHIFLEGATRAPDPGLYLRAAESLGVPPSRAIVFSASSAGVQAASAAGCRTVGVGQGEGLDHADLLLPTLDRVRFLRILAALGEEEE